MGCEKRTVPCQGLSEEAPGLFVRMRHAELPGHGHLHTADHTMCANPKHGVNLSRKRRSFQAGSCYGLAKLLRDTRHKNGGRGIWPLPPPRERTLWWADLLRPVPAFKRMLDAPLRTHAARHARRAHAGKVRTGKHAREPHERAKFKPSSVPTHSLRLPFRERRQLPPQKEMSLPC